MITVKKVPLTTPQNQTTTPNPSPTATMQYGFRRLRCTKENLVIGVALAGNGKSNSNYFIMSKTSLTNTHTVKRDNPGKPER
jgi:hypothetical protein